ncbi:MAG: type II secretion system protein [Candidatus Shapirobacteria bacterium]|nr:type II secretion system protein [Candidatus Shapirobacteria bacterium]
MLINNKTPLGFAVSPFDKRETKSGFSLIELLVTISIIAVLSAVLVANFMGMRERARDAQKIQDLNAIKSALRMYYNDKQSYPLTLNIGSSYLASDVSGYIYTQTNNGDSFNLCVNLEAGAGDEDISSQVKCGALTSTTGICGLGIGATKDKLFAVCAN